MNTFSTLEIGKTPKFFASKWLKIPFFPTSSELDDLFEMLEIESIYPLGTLVSACQLSRKDFIQNYKKALGNLFEKKELQPQAYAISSCSKDLYKIPMKDQYVLKIKSPVIQVTNHYFRYSPIDQTFRPNVFSDDKVFWGFQFAFPQIFQDEENRLFETKDLLNYHLFTRFRKWIRNNTLPTRFDVNGNLITTTMRIGKEMYAFIDKHPSLIEQGIKVAPYLKDAHAN